MKARSFQIEPINLIIWCLVSLAVFAQLFLVADLLSFDYTSVDGRDGTWIMLSEGSRNMLMIVTLVGVGGAIVLAACSRQYVKAIAISLITLVVTGILDPAMYTEQAQLFPYAPVLAIALCIVARFFGFAFSHQHE